MWQHKKDTHSQYENWAVTHSCDINYKKSSGAMESVGPVEIFKNSIQKYLIYEYLGDGDTSSFKDVVAAETYKEFGIEPTKLDASAMYRTESVQDYATW